MFTRSLWNSISQNKNFPALSSDITVDVAIIGGGITGISLASRLKQIGLSVAVLESKEVGKGTTSHSTGNLYTIIDELFAKVTSKYDKQVLHEVMAARRDAFQFIKENIERNNIDCDYKSQSMYLFENEQTNKLEEEIVAAKEAGVPVKEITREGFPFELYRGCEISEQATFNPLLYVQGLAAKTNGDNSHIYENTRVKDIEEKDGQVLLETTGGKVTAKYCVHATHTPKGIELQYHTVLGPYREYAVAVKTETGEYPEGIFWEYHKDSKYSLRTYTREGEKYLLCVGSPHKVGQAEDNESHIKELLLHVEKKYKIKEVTHKWGGQHYKPADLLPYIGKKSEGSNQFVATGFATDGLVWGSVAAMLIADELAAKENKYAELFKASRHQPGKAAGEFIKENIDVAAEFFKGLFKSDDDDIRDIQPGEAAVVQRGKDKAAVHRDASGKLSVHSAYCTHMGCVVHWNNAEKTWDCPCHGSRFGLDGDVIEGPAFKPLKNLNNKK